MNVNEPESFEEYRLQCYLHYGGRAAGAFVYIFERRIYRSCCFVFFQVSSTSDCVTCAFVRRLLFKAYGQQYHVVRGVRRAMPKEEEDLSQRTIV